MARVLLTVRFSFAQAPGTKGRGAGSQQLHGQQEFSQLRCHQTGFALLTGTRRKVNLAAIGMGAFHPLVALYCIH